MCLYSTYELLSEVEPSSYIVICAFFLYLYLGWDIGESAQKS